MLDISNVKILQKRSNERSEDRLSIEPVTVAMPAPSMPKKKKSVAAYMAGYLIKISIEQLHNLLSNVSGANSTCTSNVIQYELLRLKTFKETICLVHPSVAFANFVQTLETTFCCIFGGVMHMNDLLKTLGKSTEKDVTQLHRCGNPDCLLRI